jgi:hypothetical protein
VAQLHDRYDDDNDELRACVQMAGQLASSGKTKLLQENFHWKPNI